MKVLGFAASNSKTSINKQLVRHTLNVAKDEIEPHVDIEILDLNDFEMPIYSTDRETESGIPDLAETFYENLGAADRLIVSYAEHNGLYTAAFKNIFDWCSRIDQKVFQNKPMLAMSTSPGKRGAANVLKVALESAGFYGAQIRGSLSIANFYENFNTDEGELVEPELKVKLRSQLELLMAEQ